MDKNTLKQSILRQKEERDTLLLQSYIPRSRDDFGARVLSSPLIKVILGPRRAGKSAYAMNLLRDMSFMYFNFDDEIFRSSFSIVPDVLMNELHEVYGDIRTVFFDEIQNLDGWELFVSRLHRNGYNIILTGSNARLLSQELATALTGRHIPIEILPFSFIEWCSATGRGTKDMSAWEEYVRMGGFPEVALKKIDGNLYLDTLFESLIFRDIVSRHRVRYADAVAELGKYLVSNFSSLYTLRKIMGVFKNTPGLSSVVTIQKFMGYFSSAYLIFSLSMYSAKSAVRARSPKKLYCVDTGYIFAKSVRFSPDTGKILENAVFTEFLKQGYSSNRTIFYYKTENGQGREVDFLLKNDDVVTDLVQVSADISDQATRDREIRALINAAKELNVSRLIILTTLHEEEVHEGGFLIQILPAAKYFSKQDFVTVL